MKLISLKKRRIVKLLGIISLFAFIYLVIEKPEIKSEPINRPIKIDTREIDSEFKNYDKIKLNGDLGKPLVIDQKTLMSEQKKLFDDGWQTNAFNRYASDIIPLNRSLPDVRLPGCSKEIYSHKEITASVIMCFHNEAWSVLLRGVYSLINRTPTHLLKEIILVDDFSDQEHLLGKLDNYLETHFNSKVKVLRNDKREGLIRTRLKGARAATGDVLVFLDSHIEAAQGWLEPLLEEIYKNETTVVTPMIDIIDKDTFEYKYTKNNRVSVGGFDWNLQFTWHGLPEKEYKLRKSDHDPVRSPTMAGGLFAISKKYFEYLGTYDAQMEIWGGEVSIYIFLCKQS